MNIYFTIKDVIDYVKKKMKINVSYKLVRCLLKKDMNLTYKKCKYSNYVNEYKLKLKTIEFHSLFKKHYNNNLVVSIDEIGFSKRLNPLYSWSSKGKTKYIKNKIESVKNRNTSVCSCITSDGDIKYEISNIIEDISLIDLINIGGGLPSDYANTNVDVINSINKFAASQ